MVQDRWWFAGLCAVLLGVACGGGGDRRSAAGAAERPVLTVHAGLGAQAQYVSVSRGGLGDDGAVVRVNGLALVDTDGQGGYQGWLADAPAAGEEVRLEVRSGELVVVGTVTLPDAPIITEPPDGSTASATEPITIGWTSAISPDSFAIHFTWPSDAATGAWYESMEVVVDGSLRRVTVPASALPAGKPIAIEVDARNQGHLGGDVDEADSLLSLETCSNPVGVTR